MDKQKILKNLPAAVSSIQSPEFVKFLEELAISSTKEAPIDRQEAYYNDALNCFEKIVTSFILEYGTFFADPNSCCESFHCCR